MGAFNESAGKTTVPEIKRKENNDISICFVLELKRKHSETMHCVTMRTLLLSCASFEKPISKNTVVWIVILYAGDKSNSFGKFAEKQNKNARDTLMTIDSRQFNHWLTDAY